jgi:hypothetical protein
MHISDLFRRAAINPQSSSFFSFCHVSRSCASRSPANPHEENYAVSSDFETASCVWTNKADWLRCTAAVELICRSLLRKPMLECQVGPLAAAQRLVFSTCRTTKVGMTLKPRRLTQYAEPRYTCVLLR